MKAADKVAFVATVTGHVQGVGYRDFVARQARALGIAGRARNVARGDVEVEAEGSREALERLAGRLREGPGLARVEAVEVRWTAPSGREGFEIEW